jgi:hypothetical protein
MAEPKILLWDIETSHNIVAVFKLFGEDYINHENLLQERFVICASWKWLGRKPVESVSVLDNAKLFGKEPYNDKFVCQVLHSVLSDADVIVAHNGDGFDIKFAETRMMAHGLPPLPPITSIDTLKVAKSRFMFNSNKLDYIGRFLGVGKKIHTTPGLWLGVLRGDKSAIREMVAYNKGDVELLERVFLKLRPYMKEHINRELFGGTGCPRCGSKHVQSRGTHKAISNTYRRFACMDCGGWYREAKTHTKRVSTRVL